MRGRALRHAAGGRPLRRGLRRHAQHRVVSPVASIIVTNHNYGRWLREAIDSALTQTSGGLGVGVVDDGSTDDSGEIIASDGARITPVLQPNQGKAGAINAGFAAS